jgi:polyisoprenoid-binding protein YceI
MYHFIIPILTAVILATPGLTHASTWNIDPAHTRAQFAVRHLMVSTVRGDFGKVSGVVNLDESNLTKSSIEASIDASSIDTRNEKRDEDLKSPNFFDVAKYPTITFKSTKVEKAGDMKYKVTGNLTIHGMTKEVVLDVEGSPKSITDPYGMTRVGGVAKTRINRTDFGLKWNAPLETGGVVVGEEVDITIDLELTKKVETAAASDK